MKKLIFSAALVLSLGLAGCSEDKKETPEPIKEVEKVEDNTINKEEPPIVENKISWAEQISSLATNEDATSDKFYALEKLMMEYEATAEDVEQFKNDIIDDYNSGTYLSELENHERMLTNIFKSYIVERNSDGTLKDFAFDYHQNLKYTYRGVDATDSDSVKANEDQMNKSLNELK
ncbi:hypothetical protein CSE16_01675 [Solibacillus sp. R5-41]|uniref:hypothetical protein n=1 Tax=Solibacillus sp. R5-41 TaxID=2048654 RepID=UPI000C1295E5|nr:hypothetical protein [Solibacillus sp. R5-41]ATP38826.1 hypothetical protein CSE16_01675 [Solibacillus sp. R5-41]